VPVFANFTLVGAPQGAWETTGGNYGMMLRRGTGGLYVNGVVTRYSREAISLRGAQTMARHDEGNLRIRNLYISQTAGAFQAPNPRPRTRTATSSRWTWRRTRWRSGAVPAGDLFTAFPVSTLGATARASTGGRRPARRSPRAD
jgi:hypothetical protein